MATADKDLDKVLKAKAGTTSEPQGSLAELLKRAQIESQQGFAPAWRPDLSAADGGHPLTVSGVVTGMDALGNQYGDPYPVITIDTQDPQLGDGGRLSIHGMHFVLRNQLRAVAMDDVLGITYKGRKEQKVKQRKGDSDYENYQVVLFDSEGKAKSTTMPGPGQYSEPPVDGPPAKVQGPDDGLEDAPF